GVLDDVAVGYGVAALVHDDAGADDLRAHADADDGVAGLADGLDGGGDAGTGLRPGRRPRPAPPQCRACGHGRPLAASPHGCATLSATRPPPRQAEGGMRVRRGGPSARPRPSATHPFVEARRLSVPASRRVWRYRSVTQMWQPHRLINN